MLTKKLREGIFEWENLRPNLRANFPGIILLFYFYQTSYNKLYRTECLCTTEGGCQGDP
jgi:hypothetical protein